MLIQDSIILPLYGKNKKIPAKTGLNYWNSSNKIDDDIVFVPVTDIIMRYKPDSFSKNQVL